jgi:sortase A
MIDGQRPDDEQQLPEEVQPTDDQLHDAWGDGETTMIPVVPPEPAQRRLEEERPPRDLARTVARGIGQTLITAGIVVLLFVVYEVYVTDLFGHEKQEKATAALDHKWDGGGNGSGVAPLSSAAASAAGSGGADSTKVVVVNDPGKLVTDPSTRKRNYQAVDGQGFAKIFVPKFGPDYAVTIIEGTSTDDLYVGPGHYENTQFPGEPGNFSVAGHRVSKGSPFNELGLLSSCDALVIETQSDWFVYRVMPMQDEAASWATTKHAHCAGVSVQKGAYAQTFGREITEPSDYAQVLPVPHVESRTVPAKAERLITLTTCHPQFSDAQRMIIHGVLVKSYKKAAGFLPPELNES